MEYTRLDETPEGSFLSAADLAKLLPSKTVPKVADTDTCSCSN